MDTLKPIELTVFEALKENARLSNAALAEMFKTSESAIAKILEKLEKKQLIIGYQAVVPSSPNTTVRAFVELTVQPQKKTGYDTIAKRIYKYPQVVDHYLFSGAYDFLVVVEGESHYDIANFVADKLATIEQVTSTVTHFVFKCYKVAGIPIDQTASPDRLAIIA